jgi:hypothetical protein
LTGEYVVLNAIAKLTWYFSFILQTASPSHSSTSLNFSQNVTLFRILSYGERAPIPDWLLNVNPHLHSRSVSEDKKTSPISGSGNVTLKREVNFFGEGEVDAMVPAASMSAPAPSLVEILVTRAQMKCQSLKML